LVKFAVGSSVPYPLVADVTPGVAPSLVKAQTGDPPVHVSAELDPEFDRAAIAIGQDCRCRRCAPEGVGSGRCLGLDPSTIGYVGRTCRLGVWRATDVPAKARLAAVRADRGEIGGMQRWS
jgi:hypothetical protein